MSINKEILELKELTPDLKIKRYLFQKSLNHIQDQGKPSTNGHGTCMYKGKDNLGCGAAPFINEYNEKMEDLPFRLLVEKWHDSIDPDARVNVDFVEALQMAHDHAATDTWGNKDQHYFMRTYRNNMRMIARAAGFDYNTTAHMLAPSPLMA